MCSNLDCHDYNLMSGRNVQVIPASVLRFWRYFIFKYVLFVARYLICAIDVNAGEKATFGSNFGAEGGNA